MRASDVFRFRNGSAITSVTEAERLRSELFRVRLHRELITVPFLTTRSRVVLAMLSIAIASWLCVELCRDKISIPGRKGCEMRTMIDRVCLSFTLGLLLLCASPLAAQTKGKPKSAPAAANGPRAESLELKPGDPLSTRALTAKPTPIKGVGSWTLETRRHRSYMSVMAASPDGSQLATGGIDGTIRIWDLETGKLDKALVGHNSYVYGLGWSPDGKTIASGGSFDVSAKLWDVKTGRTLRTFKGHPDWVGQCAWSPQGDRFVAVGGSSGSLWLWESSADKRKDLTSFGHYIAWVSWSPDGERIAVAAQESPISVVSTWGGEKSVHLGKHDDGYTSVEWSPDGKRLATGSGTQVAIWNMANSDEKSEGSKKPADEKKSDENKDDTKKEDAKPVVSDAVPAMTFKTPSTSVVWSPDGTRLAVANGSDVQIWDVKDPKVEAKSIVKLVGAATRLAWLGQGTKLVGMSATNIFVWDTADAKVLQNIDASGSTPPLWTANRPVISGIGTNKLTLWDLTTSKPLKSLEGHTSSIATAAWSRDGKTIATASYDKTARIWEAGTGKLLHTLSDHNAPVTCLAFSLDNKTLATGGTEPIIRLWNVATGKADGELKGHTGPITVLAYPPTGPGLASGSADKSVCTWNLAKSQIVRSMDAFSHVYSLAWSADAKMIACGNATEQLHLFQAQSGKLLGSLSQAGSPPYVAGIAWSSDGNGLFAGRGNHTAQVWDTRTSKPVHTLPTMAPVQYVAWPAGSSVVVSGNLERTVRFWDARSGQIGGIIIEESDHIVQISAEGHYKIDPDREPDLIVVALTEDGLSTHSVSDFANKSRWKNIPASVKLGGK